MLLLQCSVELRLTALQKGSCCSLTHFIYNHDTAIQILDTKKYGKPIFMEIGCLVFVSPP